MAYRVFVRNWWTENPDYPDGLEPRPGPKSYLRNGRVDTEEEARALCKEYNSTHKPGRLSRKAEYEEA